MFFINVKSFILQWGKGSWDMKKNDKSYILALLFLVFGILLSVQFRSVLNSKKNKPSIAYQIENLQNEIKTEKLKGSKLREEIDQNIKKQDEYIKMFMERKNDDEFAREWEKAKLVAGLTFAGHYHSGFGVRKINSKYFINPGSIVRISSSLTELERKPEVVYLEFNENGIHIEEIELKTARPGTRCSTGKSLKPQRTGT